MPKTNTRKKNKMISFVKMVWNNRDALTYEVSLMEN